MNSSKVIVFADLALLAQEVYATALEGHNLEFVDDVRKSNPHVEVLSIYLHSHIDAKFLAKHPQLKLIATRSVGYDHIDIAECSRRGIVVSTVGGSDSSAVSEHSFALMLALSRRLFELRQAYKRPGFAYDRFRGFELMDKTIGLVGMGRIGSHSARIARGFGMKVLAYDPHLSSTAVRAPEVEYVSFEELLHKSDIISLHAPLTNESFHMLNREAFAKCRQGVIIINTARGALIDTDALVEAMDKEIVAGAGIDVLEEEVALVKPVSQIAAERMLAHVHEDVSLDEARMLYPERIKEYANLFRNDRLLSRPNVVFTPHVAFNSVEAIERIRAMTIENIKSFLNGKPLRVVQTC